MTTVVLLGAFALSSRPALAQDTTVVTPGDGTLAVSRLEPFEADYLQSGFPFRVRLMRSEHTDVWDFAMVMDTPVGVLVDQVGHDAASLAFAYRRFGYRAFRDEYIEARASAGVLSLIRLARAEQDPPADRIDIPFEEPFVDGTFVYWLLALTPEDALPRSFRSWAPTAQSAELRSSGPFRLLDREAEEDGGRWFGARTGGGRLETLVVPRPPYLIRQEFIAEDGTITPVIELEELRTGG